MSNYDKKPLEQVLDNHVSQEAEKLSRVGLKHVARGGKIDEAVALIKAASTVSDGATDHATAAAAIIESKALAFFEVNLAEAEAKAIVHLEKVAAEQAARDEAIEIERKAKILINEIVAIANDVKWPAIYVSSIATLNQVSVRIDTLREMGVCGRPWMDSMSENSFRFKLQSISKKYIP